MPLPTLVGWIFVLKIITVALQDTKYMIYDTSTTPSRPIIHALQVLATCMPQYHKSILPGEKMGIFIHTKFVSSSEFECNSNALIFSSNAHVLRYIKSSICLTKKDAKHSIKEMVEQLGNGISSHSQELFCMSLQYFEFL